jgi:hypothetical protein
MKKFDKLIESILNENSIINALSKAPLIVDLYNDKTGEANFRPQRNTRIYNNTNIELVTSQKDLSLSNRKNKILISFYHNDQSAKTGKLPNPKYIKGINQIIEFTYDGKLYNIHSMNLKKGSLSNRGLSIGNLKSAITSATNNNNVFTGPGQYWHVISPEKKRWNKDGLAMDDPHYKTMILLSGDENE